MVNFTCNSCGDSLKKKEVDVHFSRSNKCRQAASLTCFDCLKEFGQDYTTHTICITESQRYSANGLTGIEKTKQQVWTESLHQHFQSILETKKPTLSKSVVNLIEYLTKNANLPKKEKAFMNFVRNTRKFPEDDIRLIWNMVSEFQQKQQDQPKPDNTKKNNKSDSNGDVQKKNDEKHSSDKKKTEPAGEAPGEIKMEVQENKKKKKSKKAADSIQELEDLNITGEVSSDLNESKNQKRKREKSESVDTSQSNGNAEDKVMEVEEQVTGETKIESEKISKKEKKMRKKKEKFEAEMRAVEAEKNNEDQLDEMEEPVVEDGKKKKSKKPALDTEENVETDKKKKKKRERTVSMAAESDQPTKKNKSKGNDENAEPNEEVQDAAPVGRKEFNWADIIIQVLRSQDNNEMSIKRLCKKVVNEYLSSLLEGTHVDEVKATAKFQKKLQKTPGVFIHKDKAKLKSSD